MVPKAKLPEIVQRSVLLLIEECPDFDFDFEELPSKLSKDQTQK